MPLSTPIHTMTASDGLRLAYAIDDFSDPWRERETLILIHAAMGSSRRLYKWVPLLSRHFRVVRPDMRGHGATAIPGPDQLSLPRLTQDVIELADHLGVEKFHLAGSSAGSIVAMRATIDNPSRVLTLANFASTPGLKPSNIDMSKCVSGIREKGFRLFLEETIEERFPNVSDRGFLAWFVEESAKTDVELFSRFGPMMKAVDFTADLHKIKCPMLRVPNKMKPMRRFILLGTLNVMPGHDPRGSRQQYEVYQQHVPHSEYVWYEGLPHNITDSVPERCAADLLKFLLKHKRAS